MRTRTLMALVVAMGSCAPRVPSTPPVEVPENPGMEVTLDIPASGSIHVHLHVPAARLPFNPRYSRFEFPRVDEAWVQAFVKPRLEARDLSSAAPLDLDYDVEVMGQTWGGALAPLHGPFDLEHARYLPLANLVPVVRWSSGWAALQPVVLRVRSPLPVVSSLKGGNGLFVAEHLHEVSNGVLMAGRVREVTGLTGLRLVSPDFTEAQLQEAADLEYRARNRLHEEVGYRRPLVLGVLMRRPAVPSPIEVAGFHSGSVIVVREDDAPGKAATLAGSQTFIHELVHAHLPPEGDVPAWMTEGFAEYYATRVSLELDGVPPTALRETLVRTWRAFGEVCPDRRPGTHTLGSYYGGAVLAHCVDARLRRDGTSLGAVLKRARARDSGMVTNASWEMEMALASASAGALVQAAKSEPLDPPEPCFADEGWTRVPVDSVVPLRTLREWLGLRSTYSSPRVVGVHVDTVEEGSLLRPDDVVLEAQGQRVRSLEHLQRLAVLPAGVRGLRLVVWRGEQRVPVVIPVPPTLTIPVEPAPGISWAKTR